MRRLATIIALGAVALGGGSAFAISDGSYDPKRQHCTPGANSKAREDTAEAGCYTAALVLADGKHEYVVVGIPQTKEGEFANALEVCLDFGTGVKKCALFNRSGVTPQPDKPGTATAPETGLRVYFGADDNLNGGEHDGSEQINNGPSDGGGIQLNVDPSTAAAWLAEVQKGNSKYLLTHPLPVGDFGTGFCADGICMSIQTQKKTVYKGGARQMSHKPRKERQVSNYDGKQWDPESCSGPSDSTEDCGGRTMRQWHEDEGDVYAQPGIQIYEDPDPQGSPLASHPIPALYIGTCGLIAGGGDVKAPASPYTNASGQLVVKTGC